MERWCRVFTCLGLLVAWTSCRLHHSLRSGIGRKQAIQQSTFLCGNLSKQIIQTRIFLGQVRRFCCSQRCGKFGKEPRRPRLSSARVSCPKQGRTGKRSSKTAHVTVPLEIKACTLDTMRQVVSSACWYQPRDQLGIALVTFDTMTPFLVTWLDPISQCSYCSSQWNCSFSCFDLCGYTLCYTTTTSLSGLRLFSASGNKSSNWLTRSMWISTTSTAKSPLRARAQNYIFFKQRNNEQI